VEVADRWKATWRANEIAIVNGMIEDGRVTMQLGYHLLTAHHAIGVSRLVSIVEAVRTRILDLALTIEKTHPEAGHAGADPLPVEATQNIVTNVFGGGTNVAIASSEFTQQVRISEGDWGGLEAYLTRLGVGEDDIADLAAALESDEGLNSEGFGPSTAQWLGHMAAETAGHFAVGSSAGLIANALWHYLGLG
jgi:hypothetical protein